MGLKVLGLTAKNDGCGYHRVMMPIAFLPKERGKITNSMTEEVFADGWDILLFNRLIYNMPIPELKAKREKYGFKIVVDMDDHWQLDHGHILKDLYDSELTQQVVDCMQVADLVTCTHERLAKEIRRINPNVHVLPNALPYGDGQFQVSKVPSEKTRFVYCGGLTHQKDMRLLKNPMKRVWSDGALRDKVHMVFGGYTDDPKAKPIADDMLHSFTNGLKLKGEIRGARHVFEYMELYEDTDVSLVPLIDSPFNANKSNLKLLEASAAGNAAIVSEVNPYLDFPKDAVMYVSNQSDWYGYIKAMATFPSIREDYASKLKEYCMEHYNLVKVSEERKQVFEYLIKHEYAN